MMLDMSICRMHLYYLVIPQNCSVVFLAIASLLELLLFTQYVLYNVTFVGMQMAQALSAARTFCR